MQWLIDIAVAAMSDYLTTNPRYVDRGDPAALDFDKDDLALDNAWNDLNLSAIVPAGAKAVHLRVWLINENSLEYLWFRKKGNINEFNMAGGYVQVGWCPYVFDCIVSLDTNRLIQYKASQDLPSWHDIGIIVAGWFL